MLAQTRRAVRSGLLVPVWLALAISPLQSQQAVLAQEGWARPSDAISRAVLAARHENVSLSNASPDQKWFVHEQSIGMPSMASFAREHLWLGGLQVDPKANRARSFSTRGATGFTLVEGETGRTVRIAAPRGAMVSTPRWSPDGRRIAFFAHFEDATHVYVADATGGNVRALTRSAVLATLYTTFDWTSDSRSIVTVLVPENRRAAPRVPVVPQGPQVRLTADGQNRLRTYASLLEWPHQQEQLEYFTTGQVAIIDVESRNVRRVGAPAMIRSVDPGPRGEVLRVTTMQKPFSYIVPVSSFGSKEELWSADGRVLATLVERPLNEGVRAGATTDDAPGPQGSQDPDAMRSISWRPDGAGLSYLQQDPAPRRAAGDSAAAPADTATNGRGAARRKDRVMLWAPPFAEDAKTVVYESDTRMNSVRYSADAGTLFISEGTGNNAHTYAVHLSDPSKKHTITRTRSDDFYNNPGTLMTAPGRHGWDVVRTSADNGAVFLSGTQYFEDAQTSAPRPFIDRFNLATGEKTRIYEGENGAVSERVVALLDDASPRLIVMRESPSEVANAYVREGNGTARRVTNNRDHTPEITGAQRRRITVTRPDGFSFKVDVTLPANYREGARLPAMFWFYPREFTDQDAYDRTLRTYNRNRFPAQNTRSMEFLTLEGYAVVQPDAPITGASGRMNDNYEHDLRNNLAAVIDELDRQGIIDRERLAVGGHSYGAFSAVNAMVHTPFFRAGIAGDGAYNRTLTPLGFQSERRDIYEGRETYLAMSPFLFANNLTGALLLYHGIDDQNVGTAPINSTRLFHVLNGLGKTASLYMYPYEDHGPATEETLLDLWARWTAWLDTHVKNAPRRGSERPTTN